MFLLIYSYMGEAVAMVFIFYFFSLDCSIYLLTNSFFFLIGYNFSFFFSHGSLKKLDFSIFLFKW